MRKILVIEDERILRKGLIKLLIREGFDAIGAENGSIGIDLAQEQHPDLILCDLMMPEVDGYEVLKTLKDNSETALIPFICLTAKEERADLRQVMELGADDYLTKPFSRSELLGAIFAQLGKKERTLQQTQLLQEMIEQLHRSVYYDSLTNLPNRLLLREKFDEISQKILAQKDSLVPCFVISLSQLERVTHSLGEEHGELVIQSVAQTLKAYAGNEGIAARLSAEQFALILPPVDIEEDVEAIAKTLLNKLSKPFQLAEYEIFIVSHIGIALYPENGIDIKSLLQKAAIALHHSQKTSYSCYSFYTPAIQGNSKDRLILEISLRQAIERNELTLYYQPQVNLKNEKITRVEALVRWQHPERGLVSPGEFIPLAEETGLILLLDEWVLMTACSQVKQWQESGINISVSVNLSGLHFNQLDLAQQIDQVLESTQLAPSALELELTESAVVQNPEYASKTLKELKSLGIQLSLDDFGTGYSSLSYLQQFPFDTVKIDRSFVRNLTSNTKNAAIITAIIQMAHSLNLTVIAEGAETEEEKQFLKQNHCDFIQGYCFSAPVNTSVIEKMLRCEQNEF
ncbi:MAG: putative bifunctional diguanylate cyclase/phosphodiesterase [Chroococcales cyanobacterium]